MLGGTLARVCDRTLFSRPLVIGSARHSALLRASAPEADILLEPTGRNSAPPIAAACLLSDPDALLLVLPADHRIADRAAFLAGVNLGAESARQGRIVTFGVEPEYPATGYGYIETDGHGAVRPALRFVEKPDADTAAAYLQSGRYYWNAGIFLFRAGVMIDALARYAPDILDGVRVSLKPDHTLSLEAFSSVRSQSIDIAVLEHADNISVAPVSMGWSDLGDFRALYDISAEGADAVVCEGSVTTSDTRRAYIRGEGVHVAVKGLSDIVVVATSDGVLVKRLSDNTGLKDLTDALHGLGPALARPDQRDWLGDWLWKEVMPTWAGIAADPDTGAFIEATNMSGEPLYNGYTRGRVAPRQLFAFARARRLGWNAHGAADHVIEAALAHLNGPARSHELGWAHAFNPDGSIADASRDLYDHAFVALAGSELAACGDPRGGVLAEEAFNIVDALFLDAVHGGWCDPETASGRKRANPHMHLLEASLLHYEATFDDTSLARINTIAALFERWMFDPESGAVIEEFNSDWRRTNDPRVEPGHCYEWAHLLFDVQRLTGRDTASWRRRLIDFAEHHGVQGGLAMDVIGADQATFRLWPQLERIRAICNTPRTDVDLRKVLDAVITCYLKRGPRGGWLDRLRASDEPAVKSVPASMVYHLMTGLAPIAARRF